MNALLTRLCAAGVAQVVAVDLTPELPFPACVVRVVVPGLEGLQHSCYLPSPRARARAGQRLTALQWLLPAS